MKDKRGTITLDCGINALIWMRNKNTEALRISLGDLYSGYSS
jgi:hypothetical protein